MSFETDTERILNKYVAQVGLKEEFDYIEYGMDFVRFKKEGGNVFEIRVKEIKPRVNKPTDNKKRII